MNSVGDSTINNSDNKNRKQLLSVLSKSNLEDIQDLWKPLSITPNYSLLKSPEVGMTMVRAKTGGTGKPFNMGEMTVTRTVIRLYVEDDNTKNKELTDSVIGFGYTAGRETKKSELIAVIDAFFQLPKYTAMITEKVLQPLLSQLRNKEFIQKEKVEATKVNFFTMVRGE